MSPVPRALSLISACFFALAPVLAESERPPLQGLVLWLDAADAASIVLDPSGKLTEWKDKSGGAHHARSVAPRTQPRLVPDAYGKGRPALRFDGTNDGVCTDRMLRSKTGPATMFIVTQRGEAQGGGSKWQRLLSARSRTDLPDNKAPNICLTVLSDGAPSPYAARIDDREYTDVSIGSLSVGCTSGGNQSFFGDIAEVLVYDRTFLADEESRAVLLYLQRKWGARIAREEHGWTRVGILPSPPSRITDKHPLSDQENRAGWVRNDELSDEFDGTALDPAKWRPESPTWKGRQPARFSPANVAVRDGELHLTMRKEPIPASLAAPGYEGYTSAFVDSVHRAPYGYYEVRARPMNSAGSSSFWFSRTDIPRHSTEIDVFEIGGNAPGFERKYNMNLHVWETPEEKRHWSIGSVWLAPWRFADDFHVFGFEWDDAEIKYYIDGVLVRRAKNTHWKDPLHLHFDSETMPTWFGMPRDEDLPSTFRIDYVRAWRKGS